MGLEPTNLRLEALRGNHYSSDDCYLLKQMFNFLKCMLHEATYINRWRSRFCSFLIQIFEFWGCRNLSNISKCKKKSIWNKISEKKYLLRWGSNPRKWDKTWRNLCPSCLRVRKKFSHSDATLTLWHFVKKNQVKNWRKYEDVRFNLK